MSRSSLRDRAYAIHSMRVITIKKAARYCKLSVAQLRALISDGRGPHVTRMSGKNIAFTVRDLNKWISKKEPT